MLRFYLVVVVTLALVGVFHGHGYSATVVVHFNDSPGEGCFDATPFTPAGGNPASTVGEARRIAVKYAALIIGSCLQSEVTIEVDVEMNPLYCDLMYGFALGQGVPFGMHSDFPGAPLPATLYTQALANALSGTDQNLLTPDLTLELNSDLDTNPNCSSPWYYGLDANNPPGTVDLVTAALHEMLHGLGMIISYNRQTGAKQLGLNGTYMLNLENHFSIPSDFPSMTDAQRVLNDDGPNVHWTGSSTINAAMAIPLTAGLSGGHVRIKGGSPGHFDTSLFPNELMEPYFTSANHDPGLALNVLEDIGWSILPKNGTDIVFIMDITGSTGALMSAWLAQIQNIATLWLNFDANARFSVVSHVDFPFEPYSETGSWAYRVESSLSSSLSELQSGIANITNLGMVGGDVAESQYEAIYQVLTGAGRVLGGSVGDIAPQPLGQQNPMVIYHFTFPELFHDQGLEPNYPFAGSNPVATEADVIFEMAAASSQNMFFGLTTVTSKANTTSAQLGKSGPIDEGPLSRIAAATGGMVYDVGVDLEGLEEAIISSIAHWGASAQGSGDPDQDGVSPGFDNCNYIYNPSQADLDGDGVGDACDNCPGDSNPDQADCNLNGVGDRCDPDDCNIVSTPAPAVRGLKLFAPSPNPASSITQLQFELPALGSVSLDVFDQRGRRVRSFPAREFPAGRGMLSWDGRDAEGHSVAAGVYLVRVTAGGQSVSRRVTLIR